MNELLKRIETLSLKQLSHTTIFECFLATTEELGEVGRAIRFEEGSYGCKNKNPKESSKIEAIDLILCSFQLFFRRGGTMEEFIRIAHTKLDKFERNQNEG